MSSLAVLCAGAVKGATLAAAHAFAELGGSQVVCEFGTAGGLGRRLRDGAAADLLIASKSVLDELAGAGFVRPDTITMLGRVGVGIGIRDGCLVPDVSTPVRLREALLAASTVACSDPKTGDSSGQHFAQVLKRLGIAEELAARLVPARLGLEVAEHVLSGVAELGATQASVIAGCPGIRLAGLLPDELQHFTIYAAGVPTKTTLPEEASAFLQFLASDAGRKIFVSAGFSVL
jgi:molybdate transport system substrate-binding protein